jgi:OmpA-OmpF porin, OOP family
VRVIQTSPAKVPLLTGYGEIKTNEDYILRNIQFRYNDYTLIETSFHELRKVVEILNANKTWRVVVSGHTDDIGSEKFNMDLSLNRANSVSEYLISQGIDPSRIKAQGFGKQSPLQAGTDEAIRAINRRVELRFLN